MTRQRNRSNALPALTGAGESVTAIISFAIACKKCAGGTLFAGSYSVEGIAPFDLITGYVCYHIS